MASKHIAIDLGAESGRVMLGRVDAGRIELREVHRWPSRRVRIAGGERWDVLFMWAEMLDGLRLAAEAEPGVESVSVNSWAVDYVLLKQGQPYLTPPFMYRDERVDPIFEDVTGDEELKRAIFDESGIQFLPFNTCYQLKADDPGLLGFADGLLLMADYFNHLLGGRAVQERSNASSTQLYNPRKREWSRRLTDLLGLPADLLPELCDAGHTTGTLSEDVARATGLPPGVKIVATCSHDTGSAVAGTPIRYGSAYLSSGTWSLLGVEVPSPVISEAARQHNFTNEVGFGHRIRLLKNISGLFMVQECRKDFVAGKLSSYTGGEQAFDYATLADLAREAKPLRSLIRPELAQFARPGEMTKKIADYCQTTGQPVPTTPGQFVRCVYDSLALLYAQTLDQIAEVTGERPAALNIVGGGSKAEVLNQIAADACGVSVEAGPTEATALGNIGVQAIAAGTLRDLGELRDAVRQSFPLTTYTRKDDRYAAAAERFAALAE